MSDPLFTLEAAFSPSVAQQEAIDQLVCGMNDGEAFQTLLGVTGSGKTFVTANVIAALGRPAMVMAPNKTLAAQLYAELKSFFPNHAVEYFVSYYDYYQPEAYVPSTDTFIEKDASINAQIEQMRLSATKAILERRDCIIVATVSAIYGLGDPDAYLSMVLHLSRGERISATDIYKALARMQYTRNQMELHRASYQVRGDVIEIFPADSSKDAIQILMFDDLIESIRSFDPLTREVLSELPRVTIFPKSHYVTPRNKILACIDSIKIELKERLDELLEANKLVEHQRLQQRTMFDIEMMLELGYCSGIENYSRYLSGRGNGEPPPCLFDYLPDDALLFIDESHVTVPQVGAMYKGDAARKLNLVEYGFRLPSARDNRPLQFHEFEALMPQTVFVSATPATYEKEHAHEPVELVVRPTGILDPLCEVRPADSQVDDLISEIHACIAKGQRVLVTTLTKRMSEDLTEFYHEQGLKVKYLHSDIDTVERVQLIKDLRAGVFDVLVGINLLREGLDMPEVALVAILDADKEGFLRSERSLVQTMGRAARNVEGRVILYANRVTRSMKAAMDETQRRREIQMAYNEKHHLVPTPIVKSVKDILDVEELIRDEQEGLSVTLVDTKETINLDTLDTKALTQLAQNLEKQMFQAAKDLEFEQAAHIRDQLERVQTQLKG